MINYPTKRLKSTIAQSKSTSSKRGMSLEDDLNQTNQNYRDLNKAIIYKKPTPITVVTVDYPSRSKARITEAYYKQSSTTDYNGIYKGHYIDFEAKETQSTTAFPLSNLHHHQIQHMQAINKHGGISFLIIRFTKLDETYLLYIQDLSEFIDLNDRKSIPYPWIVEKAQRINYHLIRPVDYLLVIDETHLKGDKDAFK